MRFLTSFATHAARVGPAAWMRAVLPLAGVLACGLASQPCAGIDRIVLEVGELTMPGAQAANVTATLVPEHPRRSLGAGPRRAAGSAGTGRHTALGRARLRRGGDPRADLRVPRRRASRLGAGRRSRSRCRPPPSTTPHAAARRRRAPASRWPAALAQFAGRLDAKGWSIEGAAHCAGYAAGARARRHPGSRCPTSLDIRRSFRRRKAKRSNRDGEPWR